MVAIGVDVSNWQPNFNWQAAKAAGVEWAYCKVDEGTYFTDSQWLRNVHEAGRAGIPIGGYHFANPARDSATDSVNHFLDRLGDTYQVRPVLDIESHFLTPRDTTRWILDWCSTVKALTGIRPAVYTYTGIFGAIYPDPALAEYPLIQADYKWQASGAAPYTGPLPSPQAVTVRPPHSWSHATAWQFTSSWPVVKGWPKIDANIATNLSDLLVSTPTRPIPDPDPPQENEFMPKPYLITAVKNLIGDYHPTAQSDLLRFRKRISPDAARAIYGPDWESERITVPTKFYESLTSLEPGE